MGLPLFVAPVESDIPSKASAKTTADPAHARSPIRRSPRSPYHRSERRRQLHETREHRLRLLAALQDQDEYPPPLIPSSSILSGADRIPSPGTSREELENLLRERERRRMRRWDIRDGPQADRSQSVGDYDDESQQRSESRSRPSYMGWSADLFPSDSPPDGPEDVAGLGQVWGHLGAAPMSSYFTSRLDPPSGYHVSVGRRPSPSPQDPERTRMRISAQRAEADARRHYNRQGHRVRYVDGLGDRDRSLSPEGDGVWDTLQSTLTPDPQPPSVGSSFASTTASAAASQNTTANSSVNTSVTSPDEEIEEPPCDHDDFEEGETDGGDGDGDVDGDDEEGMMLRRIAATESSRRPTPHGGNSGRRSYADVAAGIMSHARELLDEANGRPEWLSGMHRIVRGLASRQDIPDEWWAEAGLSRSMRYEDSN